MKFVVFISKTVEFCVELYILYLISRYFRYFVEKKQNILLDHGSDFSDKAYRVIRYVKFLIFMNGVDILLRYCETYALYSKISTVKNVSPIIVYQRYLWVPSITFLDGTILLYMIFSQGQKTESPSDVARGQLMKNNK